VSEVWTVGRLLDWTAPFFQKKGIDSPRLDAEILLAHVLGCARITLYTGYDRPLSESELAAYRALVQRRAKQEPVAYLVGSQGFHEIELKVDRRVLVPRPETELLVELAAKRAPASVLDVGTGSGAIVLALLHVLPALTAVATDTSADAIAVAQDNARRLGLEARVQFRVGDYYAPVHGQRFAMIVSNPPYVAEGDKALEAGVRLHEPASALFAERDGLAALEVIIRGAPEHLLPGGAVAVECGAGQANAVAAFARETGFRAVSIHPDLAGIARVILAE
jgi:release factor glutamine methyltransferase